MANNLIEPARWVPLLKKAHILRDIMLRFRISEKFPIFLLIEPTNDCNLNCSFCPRKASSREVGYMDFELYRKIIDECARFGKRMMIGLQKDGEPLLHPSILKMIKYAKDNSAAHVVHLATNAVALNEDMSMGIIDSGLDDLLVSIDAVNDQTYRKIKGKNELPRVEDNVRRLLRLKKKIRSNKPFVRVKFIRMADNNPEAGSFKRKWKGLADWVEITDLFRWGEAGNIGSDPLKCPPRYPCLFPWYWPAINWNGDLSVCCYDFNCEGVMGNIREDSISNIWKNPALRRIRSAHLAGQYDKISFCAKCKLWGMSSNMGNWLKKRAEK
jgi:radical SAM protein with 4Fe4S-binding SPASM domain